MVAQKKAKSAEKAEKMSIEEVETLKSEHKGARHRWQRFSMLGVNVDLDQVRKAIKSAGIMSLIESILLGVLGVIVVLNPDTTMTVISYIVGGFLIVFGVYKIINYFAVRGMYDFSNNQLLSGVVAFLIGVLVIMLGAEIGGFFRVIIGIWLIYAALARMNTSIKLHVAGIKSWGYVLLVAALMMLIGIFILFNAGAVISLVGWAMIGTAVLGAIDDVIFLTNIDDLLGSKN